MNSGKEGTENVLHCDHKKDGRSDRADVAKDSPELERRRESSDDDSIPEDCEDSETLSDIDDADVDGYLHNKEETRFKRMIWENLNKEYVEEQVLKEAIAAAAGKRPGSSCPEDVLKGMKEKRRKKAIPRRPAAPSSSRSSAHDTQQMLSKKRLSSKINYDVLDKLFGDPVFEDQRKRSRIETTGDKRNEEEQSKDEEEQSKEEEEDIQDDTVGRIVYEDFDEENEDYDDDDDGFY